MTTFLDGPAQGQTMMLRRAPIFLRVVQAGPKEFDALNEVGDRPTPYEKLIFAYVMAEAPSHCHIRASKPAASGFFSIASYAFCKVQPVDAVMRSQKLWELWCEAQPKPAWIKEK